jgi:hypothetical protein
VSNNAEKPQNDAPVTLESLVELLRSQGKLQEVFIEVMPGPDAQPPKVH